MLSNTLKTKSTNLRFFTYCCVFISSEKTYYFRVQLEILKLFLSSMTVRIRINVIITISCKKMSVALFFHLLVSHHVFKAFLSCV